MGPLMKDFIEQLPKRFMHLILSVYILSIPWRGQTLFYHAKSVLVDNRVVSILADHIVSLYDHLIDRAHLTLLESTSRDKFQD